MLLTKKVVEKAVSETYTNKHKFPTFYLRGKYLTTKPKKDF